MLSNLKVAAPKELIEAVDNLLPELSRKLFNGVRVYRQDAIRMALEDWVEKMSSKLKETGKC